MGDDAAGPYFIRTFESRWKLPDHVAIEDLGTPGPELAHYLMGLENLILVDAIRAKGTPGEVRCYDKAAILEHAPVTRRSAHDPTLRDALIAADIAEDGPDHVALIGIIPESVVLRTGLSDTVRAGMAEVEKEVLAHLEALGVHPEKRASPLDPDIWWEANQG